jgi:hypothetical protein
MDYERLVAIIEKYEAKMMAKMEAWLEEIRACLGRMEAGYRPAMKHGKQKVRLA